MFITLSEKHKRDQNENIKNNETIKSYYNQPDKIMSSLKHEKFCSFA